MQMMAHASKLSGHSLTSHARGSINPLGVGSIVRSLFHILSNNLPVS